MITPHEQYNDLGQVLGAPELYFKREDLHPLGSHKGRSLPYMIDTHIKEGSTHFAISSSGNAALAAGLYIQDLNKKRITEKKNTEPIILDILVGQNISPKKLEKLERLRSDTIRVSIHDRPKQALLMKTQNEAVTSLRQSDDDSALVGYKTLAEELSEIPNLQAIFIGTSSGTTAQALAEYFHKKNVEIHIVQTPQCHPIADAISDLLSQEGPIDEKSEKSLADAIVDRVAFRKNTLATLMRKNGGAAWIADNESIKSALDLTQKHTSLTISPNSALSVAGLMQAIYTGHSWKGSVACIICGD